MKKRIVMGLVILMVMGLLMCGCGPFAGSDPLHLWERAFRNRKLSL